MGFMGLEPIVKVGCSDVAKFCAFQGYSIICVGHNREKYISIYQNQKKQRNKKKM
jgi:hypothetical protein